MSNIWIPILGGLLFSGGIIAALVTLETWIYDFGEDDEEEDEGGDQPPEGYEGPPPFLPEFDLSELREKDRFLYELLMYLYGLSPHELKLFAATLKASWLELEGGSDLAIVGRKINLGPLDLAQLTNDLEEIIRHIVNAFTGFRAVSALNIFLVFFINLVVDLMGAKLPGPLDFIKYVAQMRNLTKLVKRIEQIQKIKSKVDRAMEMEQLQDDLENAGGDLTEISGMIHDDSQTTVVKPSPGKLIGELVSSPGEVISRFTPQVWALLSVSMIGLLSLVVFTAVGGFGKSGPVEEVAGEVIVEEAPEIDLEPPTVTPAPTPTLSRLDIILRFGNFTEEQKAQIALAYLLDPEGDWIYSISTQVILEQLAQTDIMGYLGIWLRLNSQAAGNWFNNSYFPCNQEIPGGLVVCPESAGDMPEGRVLMLVMELAEPVPLADSDHFYTYAAVLDADGDPSNNFQYNPPYDWDYWQNTDQWYTLDWIPPNQSWTVSVLGENWELVESNARVVIYENVVVFFIPADEFSVDNPAFRLSAFGHDGSYSPDVSSGDVTGANPGEELLQPIEEEVLIEE